MKAIFDYNQVITATGFYELSDIGNCCLQIIEQPSLKEYYILIKTELGETKIYQFGPAIINEDILLDKFNFSVEIFQYNEKRIIKTLEKYFKQLYNITEVIELGPEEFWGKLEGVILNQKCI